MARVSVDFDSHTSDVLAAMHEQVAIALESIGQEAEGYAKKR